jgi:hypothetical protein
MPITAEDRARQTIDPLLTDAGWLVQSRGGETNIKADRGVAIVYADGVIAPDARSRQVFSCRDQQALEILNA